MQLKMKPQPRARDFRQHPAMDACVPHWLMATVYGRHLAKSKIREMHPELGVHMLKWQPEHERLLESAIDVLELRDWAQPITLTARLMAINRVMRMTLQIHRRSDSPALRPKGLRLWP